MLNFPDIGAVLYLDLFPVGLDDITKQLMDECEPCFALTPVGLCADEATTGMSAEQRRARMGDANIIRQYMDPVRPNHPWVTGKIEMPVHEWTRGMNYLRQLVEALRGWYPNKVTINRYTPLGQIGPHRDIDYDAGIVPGSETCIFSFGATRVIHFTPSPRYQPLHDTSVDIVLPSGSMLVMSGLLEQTHAHSIHPEPHTTGDRLSLAFKHYRTKD